MKASFDNAADDYDQWFTYSETGKRQRERVHLCLSFAKSLSILEVNCGTGEDALFLARKGHSVSATDLSPEMVRVAGEKVILAGMQSQVEVIQSGFSELKTKLGPQKFDLIFSNFGGINCIPPPEVQALFATFASLLKFGGQVILVVMPRFCLWESLYFSLKFRLQEVFRRSKKEPVSANVGNSSQQTWYYSPRGLAKMAGNQWEIQKVKPIGFFLPPSYLEPFFAKRKGLLKILGKMEALIGNISWLGGLSDHYLISMKQREQ